jgi:hypothetical protein
MNKTAFISILLFPFISHAQYTQLPDWLVLPPTYHHIRIYQQSNKSGRTLWMSISANAQNRITDIKSYYEDGSIDVNCSYTYSLSGRKICEVYESLGTHLDYIFTYDPTGRLLSRYEHDRRYHRLVFDTTIYAPNKEIDKHSEGKNKTSLSLSLLSVYTLDAQGRKIACTIKNYDDGKVISKINFRFGYLINGDDSTKREDCIDEDTLAWRTDSTFNRLTGHLKSVSGTSDSLREEISVNIYSNRDSLGYSISEGPLINSNDYYKKIKNNKSLIIYTLYTEKLPPRFLERNFEYDPQGRLTILKAFEIQGGNPYNTTYTLEYD